MLFGQLLQMFLIEGIFLITVIVRRY